ncbi:MAG TPA: diacylglycerol kinase family protein [Verrucomicrobiae bacterium]|jgi:diacylglycerol kinase family enzyme|nr:diacylglycerol kinase family protein [Verrucomicrobiae bacterium]
MPREKNKAMAQTNETAAPARRILILYNAWSRHRRVKFSDYLSELAKLGAQVEARTITRSFDFKALLADAADFDCLVVAGGDGTVSGAAGALQGTGVPILAYPGGTANLLARNLGMPANPKALAELTLNGKTLQADLGEIEYVRAPRRWRRFTKHGRAAGTFRTYFSIMAGCGFAARLMMQAQPLKSKWGEAAYWLSAMWNFFPRRAKFRMTLDGKTLDVKGIGILIINFEKIQFNLKVVPQSFADDGKFDIVVVKSRSLFGLAPVIWGALRQRLGLSRRDVPEVMETYRATDVEIQSRPPLRLQCDGEVLKKASGFKIHMHPGAAVFVCGNREACQVTESKPQAARISGRNP